MKFLLHAYYTPLFIFNECISMIEYSCQDSKVFIKQIENTCRWINLEKQPMLLLPMRFLHGKCFGPRNFMSMELWGLLKALVNVCCYMGKEEDFFNLGRPTSSLLIMVVVVIVAHNYLQDVSQLLHPLQLYP